MKKFFILIAAAAIALSASAQKTITLSLEQSGADDHNAKSGSAHGKLLVA